MTPDQTGVVANRWPSGDAVEPRVVHDGLPMTIMSMLRRASVTSEMIVSWPWLVQLVKDGDPLAKRTTTNEDDDAVVSLWTSEAEPAAFTFLHFDELDETAHAHTWGSPQYWEAAAQADARLGKVVAHADLLCRQRKERVLLIVCSDHGGSEHEHSRMIESHMSVPLLVWSSEPGLSIHVDEGASVLDITPTVLQALGVEVPVMVRGRSLFRSD
jgi:arylsulfatase A-like enzyme